ASGEGDTRTPPAGRRDHRRREIDGDHLRARGGGRGGDVARTGRDVEHAPSFRDAGRLEQRGDRLRRQRRERVGVVRGGALPTVVLELVKGAGHGHHHTLQERALLYDRVFMKRALTLTVLLTSIVAC